MTYAEIGCFGKLPLSPEFIRVNATGSVLRALDQWVQEGMHHARSRFGRGWSQDFLQADTWNFVFAPPSESEFLVGVASPNQDRAGRKFPFLLFLRVDRAQLMRPLRFAPVYFHDFLNAAKEVAENGWKDTDLTAFRSRVQAVSIPEVIDTQGMQERYQDYLRSQDATELLGMCLGEPCSFPKEELSLSLKKYLEAGCDNLGSQSDEGVQVPLLPVDTTSPYQIVFWSELASRVLGQKQSIPAVFWVPTPKHVRPYLFLFFRFPSPKIFVSLIRSSYQHGAEANSSGNEQHPEAAAGHTDVVSNGPASRLDSTLSLASVLDCVGKGIGA